MRQIRKRFWSILLVVIICFLVVSIPAIRLRVRLAEKRIAQRMSHSDVFWTVGDGDFLDRVLGTGPIVQLGYTGDGNVTVPYSALEKIEHLKDIQQIDFAGMSFEKVILEKLIHLPALELLDLSGTSIDDSATPALCQLQQLKALRLTDVALSPDSEARIYR